ncbi:hypothetical protein CDV31_002920 [Fusarium ambrosium]|uniref:Uncharacterized protein n=1 Tax=Fusarium ambrosium TaxID=131363 RepID=A0A428UV84_9HYPO|nr:hypothetical protein CDV31_002920 [Fusarium ambrosium]
MASSLPQPNHDPQEPMVSPGSIRKAKLAALKLRIDTHLSYKDDDQYTCKPAKSSPVTAIPPPIPAKSEKRKKGPSAVPMDSLLAPKSVYTQPLPFRRDDPDWRSPRFGRGSRPRCPEKLDLSVLPRKRYFVKNGRRVYARRGKAALSPRIIPTGDPLVKTSPAAAPLSQVPEAQLPPAQISPMRVSPFKALPAMTSTGAESVLGTIPFTDPQSPIYSASSLSTDSLHEVM